LATPLKLSRAQRAALDEIYWRMLPERIVRAADAEAAEATLNGLLRDGAAEEVEVIGAATDAAETAAARNRVRTLLLYRMSRVLTPQQREHCDALHLTTPGR
jgi:hypothetical protein